MVAKKKPSKDASPEVIPEKKPPKRLRWIALWCGLCIVVIALLVVGVAYGLLRASAPQLDGDVALVGLSAPVTIERDAHGVPTIVTANELDAVRALGYVQAQDRFFQMDVLRRTADGTLAALLGPGKGIVNRDRKRRQFRMRAVAKQVLQQLSPHQRALVGAYTLGVNQGLGALGAAPFEYLLLGVEPAKWQPEDCILAMMAMYFRFQDATGQRERSLAAMKEALPAALYRFITSPGTRWDSPMQGQPLEVAPVPGPNVVNLHKRPVQTERANEKKPNKSLRQPEVGGSSWAAAGSRTKNGAALLASDIDMVLHAPGIWYRVRLIYTQIDSPHEHIDATGMTLPGVPLLWSGSNGHIAWSLTNAHGDWVDLVEIDTDADHPGDYRTPQGWVPFRVHHETVHVRGASDVKFTIRDTLWGPVVGKGPNGHLLAAHWVASEPSATNLELWNLLGAHTVKAAIHIAARAGMPEQNFVVAGVGGHIGWTIAGRIPQRFGDYDPALPSSWARGNRGWRGWLKPATYPRIVNPKSGLIWVADNRVVGGTALAELGDGGYALGARAQQIHADLKPLSRATVAAMSSIQQDDHARFLHRWQRVLLRLITPKAAAENPHRAEFRRYVARWGERANVDSVGYRLVRLFHQRLRQRVLAMLLAPVRAQYPDFTPPPLPQFDGALWTLVETQPANLLGPTSRSWNALMLGVVDSILWDDHEAGSGLKNVTWGKRNIVHVRHRLSRIMPSLASWLDMPTVSLPGDRNMPRVQDKSYGASARMVLAPGHAKQSVFEWPGGQSGYPLSAYYGDGFKAWVNNKPTPFLPGTTAHTLVLEPIRMDARQDR